MLTENDVVKAVCNHLGQHQYRIDGYCTTKQQGEDIVAVHLTSGVTVRIEAKGETSDQPSSKRFGKPFNRGQCQVHVASALYTAIAMLEAHASTSACASARVIERFKSLNVVCVLAVMLSDRASVWVFMPAMRVVYRFAMRVSHSRN